MAKFDIYEAVTERIIHQLQQGVIPWQKPWTGTQHGAISGTTGKPYSLLNQMLLAILNQARHNLLRCCLYILIRGIYFTVTAKGTNSHSAAPLTLKSLMLTAILLHSFS